MRPEFLYIHVPFCARRCSYCDFAVQAVRVPPVAAWLEAVAAELGRVVAREGWAHLALRTVYVGGGTPSLLGPGAMEALRRALAPYASWQDETVEWTAEANPESLTPEVAAAWRRAGVNRLSLGVQSFHEPALRWMGRLHGPEGAERAVQAARRAGFENVSVDLIFGLPARLGRSWPADLERALSLEPDHISLYGLTAEPGTPLGRWVAEGRERLPDEDAYAEEYLLAAERLAAEGFHHYEVSNFARPGRESRHNVAYWSGAAYLGLGPGAHSYLPPVRRWNVRSWDEYRARIAEGQDAAAGCERVEGGAASLERVWLALRTSAGLARGGWSLGQERLAVEWARRGWARLDAERLRLTPRGWLLLDRLAVEFDAAALDALPRSSAHSGCEAPKPES